MDTSNGDVGRIPKRAAFVSSIALYIIAVTAATLRGFVRWHYGQLRLLDDGSVLFAVVCLTASFGLLLNYIDAIYITEALIYAPFKYLGSFTNILEIAVDIQIFSTVYVVISLTGIFAIKFSFLCFFRQLIDRVHGLQTYWRCIAFYTTVVWIISICIVPIGCPYYDSRAVQCAQGPFYHRALNVSIILSVFDVTSDFLIVSIPIIIIRRIKIPFKSKMYLGSSLCLSVVMIVVAIIQGATITYGGRDAIDVVWELYFQFVEVTLAILVVSLTAFRTLFIGRRAKNSRTSTETPTQKKWYSNDCVRRIWKKMSIRSTSDTEGTAWSSEIPMSNRPPSTMIQPDRTFSDTRTLADKPSSTRRSPDHGGGLNGHPTVANVETNRTAFAGRPRIEPCLASSHGRRVLDMPMVYPAIETEPATDSRDLLGARNTKPRSQISAERRISYWQRMLANGIERAHTATILPGYPSRPQSIIRTESIISGYRSHSLSTISGYSPPRSASTRTPDQIVSPLGTSPERTSALETV